MRGGQVNFLRNELAREALEALAVMRVRGEAPTLESAPTLMNLWQEVRDVLVAEGSLRCRVTHKHRGLNLSVRTLWDQHGRLHRFILTNRYTGATILVGDLNGLVFSTDVIGDAP